MTEITLEECEFNMNDVVNTPGMYVISDGISLVIASRCHYETPQVIEFDAECLFVWFVRGNLLALLNHLDRTGLSHIIFERNGGGKGIFKKYNFQRFYRHLIHQET